MAEEEKHNRLDELLDSLLTAYSDAEPRPGMKTRLLANLRARSLSRARSQRLSWRWLTAGAAAMALTAVLVAIYASRIPPLADLPRIAAAGVPALASTPAVKKSSAVVKKKPPQQKTESARVVEVRQEVFPTPAPLSFQERLLFRYLAETPPEEVAAHSHSDEPAEPSVPLGPRS
jgi:hypothetical protein